MAYYRDANSLTQLRSEMFDIEYSPGQSVIHAGIYKCTGCAREIAANETFPPQDHHEHRALEGDVRWKLLVWAQAEAWNVD
jgi:hypothetical protein